MGASQSLEEDTGAVDTADAGADISHVKGRAGQTQEGAVAELPLPRRPPLPQRPPLPWRRTAPKPAEAWIQQLLSDSARANHERQREHGREVAGLPLRSEVYATGLNTAPFLLAATGEPLRKRPDYVPVCALDI